MAVSYQRLPNGQPIVTPTGIPTLAFTVYWQQLLQALEAQNAAQDKLIADQAAQLVLIQNTQAAQASQLSQIQAAQRDIARINSYTAPTNVLTAADAGTTATVTMQAHTRYYPGIIADLALTAQSITGLAFSTKFAVYYDDATLAVTAPTLVATTDITLAQVGAGPSRHFVGVITTPADGAAATAGTGGTPPGGGGGTVLP